MSLSQRAGQVAQARTTASAAPPREEPRAASGLWHRLATRSPLPAGLQDGIERLSGVAMDDVAVHYDSPVPAELRALAVTQGSAIHLGPGQERHLAHEAWHVVQQKQGRVAPTDEAGGVAVNADAGLEAEADAMGERAGAAPPGERPVAPQSATGAVAQAKWSPPPLATDAEEAKQKIEEFSKPQNAKWRKQLQTKQCKELFQLAEVEISDAELRNWKLYGRRDPNQRVVPGTGAAAVFEPVKSPKVVDDWAAQVKEATGDDSGLGEVTTSGDGFQIGGAARAAAKGPAKPRDPLHDKALAAMEAYDPVDRKKMRIDALFSAKSADVESVQKLMAMGAFVRNEGGEVPLGATYVLAKVTRSGAKELRQFVGTGILVDKTADEGSGKEKWTTISANDLGARSMSQLQKLRFTARVYDRKERRFDGPNRDTEVFGWFDPAKMPRAGVTPGTDVGEFKDAYDQTNEVTNRVMDEAKAAEEGKKFALVGHSFMGADWHANESWMFKWEEEEVADPVKRTPDGKPVMIKKRKRVRIDKAVAKDGANKQALAYKIYPGNPDKLRYGEKGEPLSYFTTCLATASRIMTEYGIDANIFGGLMAPVHDFKQREWPIFKYLKDSGAWVWGHEGFVPNTGDVFLTGEYKDTINVKQKSRGSWSFQHVGIVAAVAANDDGTYSILSQDGGKGQASIGEDKTGYTLRNYNPKTRLMSGANPKMLIGVWRPGPLKAALESLPADIKATFKKSQLEAYEASFGPKKKK
jgi:hypothetical protein